MSDVAKETIFTLVRHDARRGSIVTSWLPLAVLALVGWVGAVAYVGRFRRHQVVQLLYDVAAPGVWYWGAVMASLILTAVWLVRRQRSHAGAALVTTAFLLGHQLYGMVYPLLPARFPIPFERPADVFGFGVARLVYGVSLVGPMLLAWWMVHGRTRHGWPPLRLGAGNLRAVGRDVSTRSAPQPWLRALLGGYAGFSAVLLVIMQANVGFGPLRSGALLTFLPAVVLAAVVNAVAEEYVFRGVFQPAFIRAGGVAAGLWMQGLMFGLMHWGMSVGLLAALPVSLLIGLGSVVWGKAALDTGGMAWVVMAHIMIDIAVMSAFFVP